MIDSPDALKELLPNVSRETIEKLAEFREMILAEDQNLISKNDKNFIWIRPVSYTHLTLPTKA